MYNLIFALCFIWCRWKQGENGKKKKATTGKWRLMRTWILKKISFRDAQLEVVGEKKNRQKMSVTSSFCVTVTYKGASYMPDTWKSWGVFCACSHSSGSALPRSPAGQHTGGVIRCELGPGGVFCFPPQMLIAQPIIIPKPPPSHPTENTQLS